MAKNVSLYMHFVKEKKFMVTGNGSSSVHLGNIVNLRIHEVLNLIDLLGICLHGM
jgi:hypothetical protein